MELLKIYNTDIETNEFSEIKEFKKGAWINLVNPSENEIKKVCENIGIQEDFIRDALDYEEKARIDKEEDDNTTLFVVDVPITEKIEGAETYTTMPLGMIVVRDDFFLTVSLKRNKIIESFEKRKIQKNKIHIPNTIPKCIILFNISKANKQRNRNSRIHSKKLNEKQRIIKTTKLRKGTSIFYNIIKIK